VESIFGALPNEEIKATCHEICLKLVFELHLYFGKTEQEVDTEFEKYYKVEQD
jgi:hypothetical protein